MNAKGVGLMLENLRPSQGFSKPILINCLAGLRNKCDEEYCDKGNCYHLNIEEAMTMTFVSLVLIQFFKAYNYRSDRN